jgi:hypothetical protein
MEVIKFQEEYLVPLFQYWKRLAETVPYFLSVSLEKWQECLLEDKVEALKARLLNEACRRNRRP